MQLVLPLLLLLLLLLLPPPLPVLLLSSSSCRQSIHSTATQQPQQALQIPSQTHP
jgi:hypothetical protein